MPFEYAKSDALFTRLLVQHWFHHADPFVWLLVNKKQYTQWPSMHLSRWGRGGRNRTASCQNRAPMLVMPDLIMTFIQ